MGIAEGSATEIENSASALAKSPKQKKSNLDVRRSSFQAAASGIAAADGCSSSSSRSLPSFSATTKLWPVSDRFPGRAELF